MRSGSSAWLSESGNDPDLFWMVLISAVVHVAIGVAAFLLPASLFTQQPPPVIAYTVKIVDPNSLGGRLPKGAIRPEKAPEGAADVAPAEAAKKPEPEKQPEPEKPVPAPEKPPEEKKPEPPKPDEKTVTLPDAEKKPEPKPEPAKPPQPEAKKPAPEKEDEKKPEPAPKKATKDELAKAEGEKRDQDIQDAIRKLGERGKGKEAAGLGGREEGKGGAGLDFIIYKNQVEGIIRKNWTWVGANPNLTVRIAFSIQQSGEIASLRIVERSGDSSYDESVMRALKVSSPLPPPPEKYREVFADYIIDFLSGELQKG
jgi:colicin import membrane protein